MQKHNLLELVEYGENISLSQVLLNQAGYRLALLNIRSGQSALEHAVNDTLTIYAISGEVTIFQDDSPINLKAGEVLWSKDKAPHRIEAHVDSSLLVVAVGGINSNEEEELDLRKVERFQRHPLVFAKFDALDVGQSFVLINDHDPIPLHRQMEAMRPHQVTWEYVVREPDTFRIRVRRIAPLCGSEISPTTTPQTLWGIQSTR